MQKKSRQAYSQSNLFFLWMVRAMLGIAFFIFLAAATDGDSICRYFLSDDRTSGCQGTVADRQRCDDSGIAADKGLVTDGGGELVLPIIIGQYGPSTEVDILADLSIAQIGQVASLGPFPNGRGFNFDKVSDMCVFYQRIGSDASHRSNVRVFDGAFFNDGMCFNVAVFNA